MSTVTDILLCTAIGDGGHPDDPSPNAGALSAWLIQNHGKHCTLKKLDIHAGGSKAMQADVYGVAVNCCDTHGLVNAFRAISWEYPESAQLMVKEEDDHKFAIFHVTKEPT